MVNCHCRDCQRAGGAGYSPTVVISRTAFRLSGGQPAVHEVSAASGETATRAFCGSCGSPLFASSSARPEMVGIRAGSLDDPSWFRATADVWTASAQPWDLLHPDTEKHAQGRARRDRSLPPK
ncbi:MAG TPA: GFA family protein [Gammaproteobacteria bacterium]|nr:GFA family protein [Gammaproteobacteria bacterium]